MHGFEHVLMAELIGFVQCCSTLIGFAGFCSSPHQHTWFKNRCASAGLDQKPAPHEQDWKHCVWMRGIVNCHICICFSPFFFHSFIPSLSGFYLWPRWMCLIAGEFGKDFFLPGILKSSLFFLFFHISPSFVSWNQLPCKPVDPLKAPARNESGTRSVCAVLPSSMAVVTNLFWVEITFWVKMQADIYSSDLF